MSVSAVSIGRRIGKIGLILAITNIVSNVSYAALDCNKWEASVTDWRAAMIDGGHRWGEYANPNGGQSYSNRFAAIYYDAQWVFYQIGDYLGESEPWNTYAEYAEATYREYLGSQWRVAGYQRFMHGLYEDFVRDRGTTFDEIQRLRDAPAFNSLSQFSGGYDGAYESVSREMAYVLQANVFAERAGGSRIVENGTPRVNQFVSWMKQHFGQWRSGNWLSGGATAPRFAPFMAALSMHALIDLAEWEAENGRSINTLWGGDWAADMAQFMLWMRNEAVVRSGGGAGQRMWHEPQANTATFLYQDTSNEPAWDLNMLIAFPFAFIGNTMGRSGDLETGRTLLETADKLFIGAAQNAWLGGGKQFDQIYRPSFRYFDARGAAGGFYGTCVLTAPMPPTALTAQ